MKRTKQLEKSGRKILGDIGRLSYGLSDKRLNFILTLKRHRFEAWQLSATAGRRGTPGNFCPAFRCSHQDEINDQGVMPLFLGAENRTLPL
jgi:hypothetical protein